MQSVNPFPKQWRLIAGASLVAAVIILAMLATGMTASAQSNNPQRAAVTGLSATPGSNPGEIDVSWDAHPAGAVDYRVAWKPVGERFRPASDTDWNANPTATGMTITGLTEGSEYKVKVRARFDSNPRSRWSSVATATATEAPQPSPTPEPTPEPTPPPPTVTPPSPTVTPPPPTPAPPDYAADRVTGLGLDVQNTSIRPYVIDYSVDGDGNPRDYYNFQLGESAEVSLSLRRLDFNADLFLEDKYGNVLASSENQGTVNEDIVATLPVGNDYHIRVEALEPGQNDYRLRIVSTDPNDATLVTSPATATPTPAATAVVQTQTIEPEPPAEPLTSQQQVQSNSVPEPAGEDFPADVTTIGKVDVGGSVTGNVGVAGDEDWYAVELTTGVIYQFDAKGASSGNGTLPDPALRGVHKSNGRKISGTSDWDNGKGEDARDDFWTKSAGTYYVSVGTGDNDPANVGTYVLEVSVLVAEEYAANTSTNGRLELDTRITVAILFRGETTDWYAFDLEAGKDYYFRSLPSTGWGILGNIIKIYDSDGNGIPRTTKNYAWQVYDGSKPGLYFQATTTGTHYIELGFLRRHGLWDFVFTQLPDDEIPSSAATTAEVEVGGSYKYEVGANGDRDWIKVDLTAGKRYEVKLTDDASDQPHVYPALYSVRNPDGVRISNTEDTYRYRRTYARAYFDAEVTGTYYVEAGSLYSSLGKVVVTAEEVPADTCRNQRPSTHDDNLTGPWITSLENTDRPCG